MIDSLGGKTVTYSSILNLMGLTSPTTRSFLNRISASKQFGFITTGGSMAQLTDLAKRILYPSAGEDETKQLLIESFGDTPTSYYDLWRVEEGKIAEHWDVMEKIADKSIWQNQNGKF